MSCFSASPFAASCPLPAQRRSRPCRRTQRSVQTRAEAATEEAPAGGIGMSAEMQSIMDAAAGGKAVPGWVPAIPQLELALKVLASDSVVISDQLLVERYGESLFAATGFTKTAELINGRLAMLGCVAALGAAGKGDVLVQLARAPMGVALVFALVATGTLVPQIDAEAGYIPGNVRQGVEKLLSATKLDEFFSETAETVNGRAAMLGFLGFTIVATII